MIIGNGMLAKAFSAYAEDKQYIIFASGVSDSNETRTSVFRDEENLLRKIMQLHPDKILVYFSTCSIYDSSLHNSVYVHHKSYMEYLVRSNQSKFIIFRLPQVVGVTQSPTIVNFLYQKIFYQQHFELWRGSRRNLIDVDDVVKIIHYILKNQLFIQQTVNLASTQSSSIYEIVMILEQLTEKRAIYSVVDKHTSYDIDLSQIQYIYQQLEMKFDVDYVSKTINKYYANM